MITKPKIKNFPPIKRQVQEYIIKMHVTKADKVGETVKAFRNLGADVNCSENTNL